MWYRINQENQKCQPHRQCVLVGWYQISEYSHPFLLMLLLEEAILFSDLESDSSLMPSICKLVSLERINEIELYKS